MRETEAASRLAALTALLVRLFTDEPPLALPAAVGATAVTAGRDPAVVAASARPPVGDGPSSSPMGALAKLVPVSQIVYGTDYPYRATADHTKGLAAFFGQDDLKKVDRENALRLLPRWRDV